MSSPSRINADVTRRTGSLPLPPNKRHQSTLKIAASIFAVLICVSLFLQYRAKATSSHNNEVCLMHTEQISKAIIAYRNDHKGQLPDALFIPRASRKTGNVIPDSATLFPKYISSIEVFSCPSAAQFQETQGKWNKGDITYSYEIQWWILDSPQDVYPKQEFYEQIVPKHSPDIRLVRCSSHPGFNDGEMTSRTIMWDGSIRNLPWLYDNSYGVGNRVPEAQRLQDDVRKKGGKMYVN